MTKEFHYIFYNKDLSNHSIMEKSAQIACFPLTHKSGFINDKESKYLIVTQPLFLRMQEFQKKKKIILPVVPECSPRLPESTTRYQM